MGELTEDFRCLKTKHIEYIGYSPVVKSAFTDANRGESYCSYYLDYVSATGDDFLGDLAGYIPVVRSKDAFVKSFMKCDLAPVYPTGDWFGVDLAYLDSIAKQYTEKHFAFFAGSMPAHEFSFNPDTSCGIPFNRRYKTKKDFIESGLLQELMRLRHIPIYSVSDKDEFLPREDVLGSSKIRTIFGPDIVFLAHQKVLTDWQNDKLMSKMLDYKNCWSRYGIAKQYGGYNNLYKFHERFDLHITGDGSGWDRAIPLIKDSWEIRRSHFDDIKDNREFAEYFDYVAVNTYNPMCGLPDGNIYRRKTGNASGSNSTTSDNCMAHTRIAYLFLLMLYWRQHRAIAAQGELHEHTAISLYGDDSLDSLESGFFNLNPKDEETLDILRETFKAAYGAYGVLVKEAQFHLKVGKPAGLEFLGSTAIYHRGIYYPKPRLEKLTTSITRCLVKKTPQQMAASLTALYSLVAPVPDRDCQDVRSALVRYVRYLNGTGLFSTEGVSAEEYMGIQEVCLDNPKGAEQLMLGFESKTRY